MDLQTTLDFTARLVQNPEPGDRCRSGDGEIQVQERADGDLEIVVMQRLASIKVDDFRPPDEDKEDYE